MSFFLCTVFLGLTVLLPYLDATFYRMPRLQNRGRILTELAALDIAKVYANPLLQNSYAALLAELDSHESDFPASLAQYFQKSPDICSWATCLRFLAGSFLAMLLFPFIVWSQDKKDEKITTGVLLAIIGIFSGCISVWLPTFRYERINYILGAVLQFVLLTSVFIKLSQMNALEESQSKLAEQSAKPQGKR